MAESLHQRNHTTWKLTLAFAATTLVGCLPPNWVPPQWLEIGCLGATNLGFTTEHELLATIYRSGWSDVWVYVRTNEGDLRRYVGHAEGNLRTEPWVALLDAERGAAYETDSLVEGWLSYTDWPEQGPLFAIGSSPSFAPSRSASWAGSVVLSREGASPETLEMIDQIESFCRQQVAEALAGGGSESGSGSGSGEGAGSGSSAGEGSGIGSGEGAS